MTKYLNHIFFLFLVLTACNNVTKDAKSTNIFDTTINSSKHSDSIQSGQNKREYVSDTVKRIIDELNLCDYSEFLKNLDNYSCYDKDVSDIRNIKSGDNSYDNFIFQSPGGSAGGAIIVFCKRNGKYIKIQEDQGCIIEILKTTTNGFYDLIIWHKAHKPHGENILYKWTGKKYLKSKVIKDIESNNNGG
jgi:hypothetical protein